MNALVGLILVVGVGASIFQQYGPDFINIMGWEFRNS